MRFKKSIPPLLLAMALGLGACVNTQSAPKQTLGTLIGTGAGALVGSKIGSGRGQLAAVAVGALGGAMMGAEVGRNLDEVDRLRAEQARQSALEYNSTGSVSEWRNPNTGHAGRVRAGRVFYDGGTPCREYEQTIYIDGRPRTAAGTACRRPDGRWETS